MKISTVLYMNLFQHPLERLVCFLLYVTVGSSSVLEYPYGFWLTYESFEMQGNCQSFRLIDHLVFCRFSPVRSVWSVYSAWCCLICVIIISFRGNYRSSFLLIIFVIIKLQKKKKPSSMLSVIWCFCGLAW